MTLRTATGPKALIITTVHWPATTRLGLALIESGFAVAAVAVPDHGLRRLPGLDASFVCRSHFRLAATVRHAIETWSPDIVIPGDDPSLQALHELHSRAKAGQGHRPARMMDLIETSLGDPAHFSLVAKRSAFTALAKADGIRIPVTETPTDVADLRARLAGATFPKVLKVDGTWGGLGVRIVHNVDEAERAFVDLASLPKWSRIAKRIVQGLDFAPLQVRLTGEAPTVTLQEFIHGRPANCAVLCWKGHVLAELSVEVLQTGVETGPSTVVRVVDNQEMKDVATHVVRRLNLSGFCGFDFMRDDAGFMHLLELNARTTQICHLALSEQTDMLGALYAQLTGTARRRLASAKHDVIAFFPQEYWRDPASSYLSSAYHDVPWQAPQVIAAYLQPPRHHWLDELLHVVRTARGLRAEASALGAVPMTPSVANKGRG